LQDKVTECRGSAAERGYPVPPQASFNGVRSHRLTGSSAGEQPTGVDVGRSGEVEPVSDVVEQ
jgi:hypothetical protein